MMRALAFAIALLAATSARADPSWMKPLMLQLEPLPQCDAWAQPGGWRDASDAFVFAAHPTAWHDMEELHAAAALEPLVGFVLFGDHPRLLVLGYPRALPSALTLRYSGVHTGWTRRWPNCG